jgi:hypothetical protein
MRSRHLRLSMPGPWFGPLRCLSFAMAVVSWGCGFHGFGPPDPPDCPALSNGPWHVGRGDDAIELAAGESRRESVTPGYATECASSLTSVTWMVEDPSVAAVDPLGPRNSANDTAGDIARAWITGLAPGVTVVKAVVHFTDGPRDAGARTVRVGPAAGAPPGSFVVAQGEATFTFNQFTNGGGSELIPIVLPRSGRVDIAVDWTSLGNRMAFFLWEGSCTASPCPGRLVVDAQLGPMKPRRESAADLSAGEYTFRVGGVGTGQETARYEVRLTPN